MSFIFEYISKKYAWYVDNLQKIVFIVALFFIFSYLLKLPYINIFVRFFALLPHIVAWIAILLLFKPRKESILKVGFFIFAVGYLFTLVRISLVMEIIGQVGFFIILTYLIMSVREIREK
ncbi:hypothetical protein LBMAG33_1490 [Candidatus Levyibacteriota bacterium]|nr:hypothetical protein [Candidatus Levybacteria bacterium]GDX61839.1 hypothetical protein LBMAG33_1490 [Candidatus Levybacteria bacterium]